LLNISNQCFRVGGLSAFRAPAALQNCYLVAPDFWENCGEERFLPLELFEEEERLSATSNHIMHAMRVVAINGMIEITGENLNDAMVSISDLMGRSVVQYKADSNTDSLIRVELPQSTPTGLMFITIWSATQTYSTKVFVYIHK